MRRALIEWACCCFAPSWGRMGLGVVCPPGKDGLGWVCLLVRMEWGVRMCFPCDLPGKDGVMGITCGDPPGKDGMIGITCGGPLVRIEEWSPRRQGLLRKSVLSTVFIIPRRQGLLRNSVPSTVFTIPRRQGLLRTGVPSTISQQPLSTRNCETYLAAHCFSTALVDEES